MELKAVKTNRLYVKIAEQLSQLVKDGVVKPGERFPAERELAEKLGVSRPTIREAMIALELSGLIEIRTGSGIYVTDKSPSLSIGDRGAGPFEIMETRLIIESEACAIAATKINPNQLERLKAVIDEMQEEEKRPDASEKSDWKFHQIVAEATQNTVILSMVNWLWELRNQSALSTGFLERIREEGIHPSIEDHVKIMEALSHGDAEEARIAMRQHIENASAAASTYFGRNE